MKRFIILISVSISLVVACSSNQENIAISFDGVPIHFDAKGEGSPALVFITGWGGNRTNWEKQLNYFSNKHKVIAIDYAGFGDSGNNREEWTMESFDQAIAEYPVSPRKGWAESARQFFKWSSNDLTVILQKTRAPICCINSDSSPTKIEVAQQYAPNFKVKIIPGAGHAVMMDAPNEFNQLLEKTIQEFLNN